MSLNGKLILGYMPGGTGQIRPFHHTFNYAQDVTKRGFDNVDAIVVWGGEDIDPSFYKEKPNRHTQAQRGPTERDRAEWSAMKYAKMNGIPIIGVCRGAQFLCVASGGKLVQHVTGHVGGQHNIMFADDGLDIMSVTSCHHQMMYPWKTDYQLLAWSTQRLSTTYQGEDQKEIRECHTHFEPEVVYFPKTRGFAVQGHPEWMDETDPFVHYCNEMIQKLLLRELLVA